MAMKLVSKVPSRRHRSPVALLAGALLGVGAMTAVLASPATTASASARAASPVLLSVNVPKYSGALGDSKKFSLYLLQDERGGKLHCVGSCLQFWLPLYVAKGSHPTVGAGVKGKVGVIARKLSNTVTKYQVTFNTYPVYVYSGDSGPAQAKGEHIEFAKGVYWYLLRASATTAASTAMTKAPSGGGGGGGW
jgi:predicted lipoprotein with Yx(FWY)xxD motif